MEQKFYSVQETKKKMMAYCAYQDRCHQEVEQKMREYVLIPEARDQILLYLLKENFLNEERFTRSFIHGKFYIKHWGRVKIKIRLKQKGITEKLILKCMDEIQPQDYVDSIKREIQKLLPKCKGLQKYQKKSKVTKSLLAKGYEFGMIQNILEEVFST